MVSREVDRSVAGRSAAKLEVVERVTLIAAADSDDE